jgi:putative transferase (TIGR04331 family)
MVSAVDWWANEAFSVVAAESSELGGTLIFLQHGGEFGISRIKHEEKFGKCIADKMVCFGWAPEEEPSSINLPNPRTVRYESAALDSDPQITPKTLLFCTTAAPKHPHCITNLQNDDEWNEYKQWQHDFLKEITQNIRNKTIYRPPEKDRRHGFKQSILDKFPEVRHIRDWSVPIDLAIRRSRIVAVDNRESVYLQAMALNVPTVLFYEPKFKHCRESAKPYIELLKEVGILWNCPLAAAKHINKIYDNPLEWWAAEKTHEARRIFVNRFCKTDPDWLKEWGQFLLKAYLKLDNEKTHPGSAAKCFNSL